jgi:hypothetical protein
MDVRVIRALHASCDSGKAVKLPAADRTRRPTLKQEITRPPVKKPEEIHAESPAGD